MIEVVDHDGAWPRRFQALREEYSAALSAAGVPCVAIEHVGSTSVPGLAAKPVIDCDIVVAEPYVADASRVLEGLGFEARGELGIPQRWAFWEPERLAGTNTYVVVEGSLALRNHLAVRDTLRADAGLRAEYGAVKKLVAADAADIYEYGAGKNEVIQRILAVAGLTESERESIHANQVPVTPERRVRRATDADIAVICAIGRATWPETYAFAGRDYVEHGLATWWSEEAVRRGLVTTVTLVAESDGAVVGMGNVDLRPEVPVIWKLYVLPEHQGSGVGGRLLRRLLDEVPADRRAVAIEYVDGNDRAAAVYAKNGFVEVRREPAEQPGWPDQIWAERSLPRR